MYEPILDMSSGYLYRLHPESLGEVGNARKLIVEFLSASDINKVLTNEEGSQ